MQQNSIFVLAMSRRGVLSLSFSLSLSLFLFEILIFAIFGRLGMKDWDETSVSVSR